MEQLTTISSSDYESDYDCNKQENSTGCSFPKWDLSYSVIAVLQMLIFILGLSGNGMVIFTVFRAQDKRRTVDIYIGNLAMADLTFVLSLPQWAVYLALGFHWPFGAALCKISSYMFQHNMNASIFCLTAMSFDRYQAIVHPLSSSQLRTRSHTRATLTAIWLLSGLLAVPMLIFSTTKNVENTNHVFCTMDFSQVLGRDNRTASHSKTYQEQMFMWFIGLSILNTLAFLLPFLAMTVCYCFIGCKVSRHFKSLHKDDQRKRRLLKIITILVVVCAVCWTPYHMLFYLTLLQITCAGHRFLLLARQYAIFLAYLNSCLNPFLYAFFDLHFHSQCLRLLNHARQPSQLPALPEDGAQSLATNV